MIFVAAIHGPAQRFRFIPHSGRATTKLEGIDLFAKYLANDCSPAVAARLAGYQPGDADFLLKLLCADLGPQAR